MIREALLKILQYLRQRPTLLGAVLGFPFAFVMLIVLEHWPTVGWVSVLIWIVLGHFWFNHPLIKTLSMASLVGMVLATAIWANEHTHDRVTLGADKVRQHLWPWGHRP